MCHYLSGLCLGGGAEQMLQPEDCRGCLPRTAQNPACGMKWRAYRATPSGMQALKTQRCPLHGKRGCDAPRLVPSGVGHPAQLLLSRDQATHDFGIGRFELTRGLPREQAFDIMQDHVADQLPPARNRGRAMRREDHVSASAQRIGRSQGFVWKDIRGDLNIASLGSCDQRRKIGAPGATDQDHKRTFFACARSALHSASRGFPPTEPLPPQPPCFRIRASASRQVQHPGLHQTETGHRPGHGAQRARSGDASRARSVRSR